MIIAVDGPTASGKGTIAKALAAHFGLPHLDTGLLYRAVGRQVGGADSARLKVSFAPAWLSFIPAVWGDYWVVDLDPEYSLVAVSEPKREYLWVLSRTPQVDAARYTALLARLEGLGFDVSKLVTTKQMD